MNSVGFFSNKLKCKCYLIFHLIVAGLYFITILSILHTNSQKYFLFFIYLMANLFLSLLIFYKSKYCQILLNIFGILMLILATYSEIQLILNYVNTRVINILAVVEFSTVIFFIFYLIYLNSKNKIEEVEEIDEIGKFEIFTNN